MRSVESEIRELKAAVGRMRLALICVAIVVAWAVFQPWRGDSDRTESSVVLRDDHGRKRIEITSGNANAGLSIRDLHGRIRAHLVVLDDGTPSLTLSDATGSPRIIMAGVGDRASVALYGPQKHLRVLLAASETGEPHFAFYDQGSQRRAQLRIARDGTPEFVFFDHEGMRIWSAPY